MGTKAVFAIASSDDRHFTTILGMTVDGSPQNLYGIARDCEAMAKKLNCLEGFRERKWEFVSKVLKEIEKINDGFLFIDNIKNAC